MDYGVRQYRLQTPDLTWQQTSQARLEAGKLWSRLVLLHKYCRKHHLKWPTKSQLHKHFKGRLALHSQTTQAITEKFLASIKATRTARKNGDLEAAYPWRTKRYANVVWKGQSIRWEGTTVILPMGQGRSCVRLRLPERPQGEVVQAELDFGRLLVTIRREVVIPCQFTGVAAMDMGLIHLGVVTDGQETMAIVGRGLRSIKQGRAKKHAELATKISRCKLGSRRRHKLIRARYKVSERVEDQARNALHHASKAVVEWCAKRGVGNLVVGDITDITRDKSGKASKSTNQGMGSSELGQLVRYLEYKGVRSGLVVTKIPEPYTSQTCPAPDCGKRNKPTGRIYRCDCGFTGIRDQVGASNILNLHLNGKILAGALVPDGRVKYLRPVRMHTRRSRAADTCLGTVPRCFGYSVRVKPKNPLGFS